MDNSLSRLNKFFAKKKSEDPITIIPYRGYAGDKKIFLKGRVLEDENIFTGKSDRKIRNIINSLKRFETDEIPEAPIKISFGDTTLQCKTDYEGYFTIDSDYQNGGTKDETWLPYQVDLLYPTRKDNSTIQAHGEIMHLSPQAEYGIVTDIDDTILQTHVTSLFRLKMLYATFFKNAHQRLPIEGMPEVLQLFSRGSAGTINNPIFYLSHSPWNIYDLLSEFLDIQKFPKGPILLRDYGLNPSGHFKHHKIESITHILKTYPHLPFLLFGDAAEEDADFYLEIAHSFPNRIKAIFIRQNRNTKNAQRVKRLIENNSHADAFLIHSKDEILSAAKSIGII